MNYFSKFDINPQRRESRKLLNNPRAMHASVLSLFPPDQLEDHTRVLWRLDSEHPRHTLYVTSPIKPDFSHLQESSGWDSAPGQTTDYTKFLQQIVNGSEWFFRLQANPTKALRQTDDSATLKRGTVIPLVKEDQQIEWLQTRANQYGFTIPESKLLKETENPIADVRVIENTEQIFFKQISSEKKLKIILRKSIFEGRLIVTDEIAVRRALIAGIGRAKSYGYGLLTLRRP